MFHFKISQMFLMPQSKTFLPIFQYSLRFPCDSLVLLCFSDVLLHRNCHEETEKGQNLFSPSFASRPPLKKGTQTKPCFPPLCSPVMPSHLALCSVKHSCNCTIMLPCTQKLLPFHMNKPSYLSFFLEKL